MIAAGYTGGAGDPGATVDMVWVGRCVEIKDIPDGNLVDVSGDPPSGQQQIICWGLMHDLDQVPVITTVMSDDDTGSGADPTLQLIHRAVGFNMGKGAIERDRGQVIEGNRSVNNTADGCDAFREKLDGAQTWGLIDAVQYLLKYYVLMDDDPTAMGVNDFYPWELNNPFGGSVLSGLIWKEHTDGRSTRDLINLLFNRKRALGYYVDGNGDNVELVLFTMTPVNITLGGGQTLPANPNTLTLDFTNDIWAESVEIRDTGQTQYDQIIARGERKGTVATFSGQDETIKPDWSTSQQDLYNAGASTVAGYGALADWDKQQRNDAVRQQRPLERVYCWWRIYDASPGHMTARDGEGGSDTFVFPTFTQDGGLPVNIETTSDNYWYQGLRLEHYLPFYVDTDYSSDYIADGTTVNNLPSGSVDDFQPPIMAMKVTRDNGDTAYVHLDKMASELQAAQDPTSAYGKLSCSLTMQDQAPGFKIQVHAEGRPQQHAICKSEWDTFGGGVDTADKDGNAAIFDWTDNLLLTVYIKADSYAECRVPTDAALTSIEITRLVIDVPDAYMDWVVPGTVVAIHDGQLVRSSSGGLVRNDFLRLQRIAMLASGWFAVDRQTATVTYKRFGFLGDIGDLITSINGTTVNTVITSLQYDFVGQKTIIQTQHGELDFGAW